MVKAANAKTIHMKFIAYKTHILAGILMTFGMTNAYSQPNQQQPKTPPTVDEIFNEMDLDKDGLISEDEAKGPLKNDFIKIDTDKDGFISRAELEKAPKPEGNRPPRQ